MYLNLIQIAESLGVSEAVIERWMREEGLPNTPDRGKLLFDRAQVAAWAAGRGLAAQAGFLAPETAQGTTGWKLDNLLRRGGIWRDVRGDGVRDVFRRVVDAIPGTSPAIRQLLGQRMLLPDGVTFAPVGAGVALPHPRTRVTLGREAGVVALILVSDQVALTEPVPDQEPVNRLFFFVAPSPRAHLDLLGRLSRLLRQPSLRALLKQPPDDEALFRALAAADQGPASQEVRT